ncbi:hypothetical protein TNCV_552721 [Trichonephila clavipes]|nr:hypothetical protein TNCV_552721 [Trichonephila clavipes]
MESPGHLGRIGSVLWLLRSSPHVPPRWMFYPMEPSQGICASRRMTTQMDLVTRLHACLTMMYFDKHRVAVTCACIPSVAHLSLPRYA